MDLVTGGRVLSTGRTGKILHGALVDRFAEFVAQVQRYRSWYRAGLAGASLAHRVIRTLVWDLIAEDTLLFQAAIFVSGTYSNTCGIPSYGIRHGPAVAAMKGSSLRALRKAAFSVDQSSYKTAAVALLAGWEHRFGDRETAKIHMEVWRSLPLPEHTLDEAYVLTLLEVMFETFRESLNTYAGVEDETLAAFLVPDNGGRPYDVPEGFNNVFRDWHESKSLRAIVSKLASYDPQSPEGVACIRQLCIEGLAWDPSHSQAYTPLPAYEDTIEEVELKTLYHIRAACVSISAMFLRIASDIHQVQWIADVEGALEAHTMSCHHLPTEVLIRNGLAEIALWSRYILCIAARDTESDALLKRLMAECNVMSWSDLKALLVRHIVPGVLLERCRDLYDILSQA